MHSQDRGCADAQARAVFSAEAQWTTTEPLGSIGAWGGAAAAGPDSCELWSAGRGTKGANATPTTYAASPGFVYTQIGADEHPRQPDHRPGGRAVHQPGRATAV